MYSKVKCFVTLGDCLELIQNAECYMMPSDFLYKAGESDYCCISVPI